MIRATVHIPAEAALDQERLAELPTPCLVVGRSAFDRNLARAAAAGIPLRPHFKAHKCSRAMLAQIAAGNCTGATCATAAEAGRWHEPGSPTSWLPTRSSTARRRAPWPRSHARARSRSPSTRTAGLQLLEERCAAAGAHIGVLVDLDVGQHRCGLDPEDPAVLDLAERAAASPHLELRGLMGYEGHAQHEHDPAARGAMVRDATEALADARRRIEASGLACPVVSGGGTGTLAEHAAAAVLTEVQVGSYAFGDRQYAEVGVGFEQAIWCLATVISRRGDVAVANAGLKQLAGDDGPPGVDIDGVAVIGGLSDEHAVLHARRRAAARPRRPAAARPAASRPHREPAPLDRGLRRGRERRAVAGRRPRLRLSYAAGCRWCCSSRPARISSAIVFDWSR